MDAEIFGTAIVSCAPMPPTTPPAPRARERASATAMRDTRSSDAAPGASFTTLASIDALPRELLLCILAPLREQLVPLLAARGVSRGWRDTIDGEVSFWTRLLLSRELAARITEPALAALLRRARGALTELDVTGAVALRPAALAAAAARQPRLRVLRAAGLDASRGGDDEARWWTPTQGRAVLAACPDMQLLQVDLACVNDATASLPLLLAPVVHVLRVRLRHEPPLPLAVLSTAFVGVGWALHHNHERYAAAHGTPLPQHAAFMVAARMHPQP